MSLGKARRRPAEGCFGNPNPGKTGAAALIGKQKKAYPPRHAFRHINTIQIVSLFLTEVNKGSQFYRIQQFHFNEILSWIRIAKVALNVKGLKEMSRRLKCAEQKETTEKNRRVQMTS